MSPFHQNFTIHPVGQGLFYSCTITHKDKVRFRMVFDCGSNTAGAGQSEVNQYREDPDYLKEKKLDLLVISHFDADHVKFVGKLLEDGVKIGRLVMPIITFEERLFLLARQLHHTNGFKPEDAFGFRLMIDPVAALGDHFDDDTQVYLIEADPKPIPPQGEDPEGSSSEENGERFVFDFDARAKEEYDEEDKFISKPSKGKLYKVKDVHTGKLRQPFRLEKLMDFLFYKRSVGAEENQFFEVVTRLFNKEYKIPDGLLEKDFMEQVFHRVSEIKSAKRVRMILKQAQRESNLKVKLGIDVKNPNTTALCLLHRNLDGIYDMMNLKKDGWHQFHFVHHIQVYKPRTSRVLRELDYFEEPFYRRRWTRFPNVLLTSDSFLLEQDQVDELYFKYQYYWEQFWMFQIPHHGSQNNADQRLLSLLQAYTYTFINYGTKNKDKHPSPALINDLVSTGLVSRILHVHEFLGLCLDVYSCPERL